MYLLEPLHRQKIKENYFLSQNRLPLKQGVARYLLRNGELAWLPFKNTQQKVSSKKLGTSRASYAFALYKQDLVMDM